VCYWLPIKPPLLPIGVLLATHQATATPYRCVTVSDGRKVFREFLKTEYSEENLLFWVACEELRTMDSHDEDAVEDQARTIYEDYISTLSPKEVRNSLTTASPG